MSKLIVEMEMPKSCPCDLIGVGYDLYCSGVCGIPERVKEYYECMENGTRPDWCPICGVLPDEHVDLIDRDELFETIRSRVTLIDSCPEGKPSMKELFERDVLCTCLHDVVCAKAVIAAERKDDGTTAD